MAIACYLAMTAAEFSGIAVLPPSVGWLSCHFSLSGQGLSNIPKALPKDSLLILDDSNPFQQHQPDMILEQLQNAANALSARALLLDFQRRDIPKVGQLAQLLEKAMPCPVIVPPWYAKSDSTLFLPPAPLYQPLERYLEPYKGRKIWLDAAFLPAQIVITNHGSHHTHPSPDGLPAAPHWSDELCCHYGLQVEDDRAIFTFAPSSDGFQTWLHRAEVLGVEAVVGLYQEWIK